MSYEDAHTYKLGQPTFITNTMVNMPICLIVFALIIMGILSIIVNNIGWLSPNDPSNRDFLVWGAKVVNDFDRSLLIGEAL